MHRFSRKQARLHVSFHPGDIARAGCKNEFISNEAILRMRMCAARGQYSTVE